MAVDSVLRIKSEKFSERIVKCYKYLQTEKKEQVMAKQLLRSGTSIGANINEGIFAQSRADFVNKLSISLKEAQETSYWLKLLYKSSFLNDKEFHSIYSDNEEIIKMLISTIKTVKKKESGE